MMRLIRASFWTLVRILAWFRYSVTVEGLDKVRDLDGPILLMPNHPGLIDPPLVLSHVRLKQSVRPIVTTSMYRNPALYPMMRMVDAVEVPDLGEQSRDAREQTLTMIDTIAAGLDRGENFLIYPAGRTERRGFEQIGAARAAADLLQRCPQAKIVLVRTRGVWGSMFTFAPYGTHPNLNQCVIRAFGWVLAALAIFLPRRKVTMTVELIDRSRLPGIQREQLNPFLEEWYNRGAPEQPVFVPYSYFFGPQTYAFPELAGSGPIDLAKIKPATITAVNEMVAEHLKRPLSENEKGPETLLEKLGLDSLERMDLALEIEDRFGFRSDQVAESLGELWALADGQKTVDDDARPSAPPDWIKSRTVTAAPAVLAETLAEAFMRRVLAHPDDTALVDPTSGTLTYRKLLVAAMMFSRRVAELPGDDIGVLLPASAAADITFIAIHLAGKVPVMLNWTTGPANLAHAVAALGVKRVLTSRKLIDRLDIRIQGADYVYLEEIKRGIGKFEALRTLVSTYLLPNRLLHRLPKRDIDKPAVVLFTSGSESTPKAVPLSHRNLIANVRGAYQVLQITRDDVILGFLPPFHSFGLMGNILAPLLGGLRVAHYPDPTNAAGLVRTTATYGASIIVTTPTFLGYMYGVAKPHDLASLRIIVAGAEKVPDSIFERTRQLASHAALIEGYGITECSPVICGNPPQRIKQGTVGPPLEGVELCVVDPDDHHPLAQGATGLLLVRGASVFNGYINYNGPDPFLEVNGKRWYVTGDLVKIDTDGYVTFCGRLKRFLKVGGEMVSLPALEEPFVNRYPPTEEGPQVAIEGVDTPSRWITLFATHDINLRDANALLAESGFRGVLRLDEVIRIDKIPVLGTGKTDYKVLRKMIADKIAEKVGHPA